MSVSATGRHNPRSFVSLILLLRVVARSALSGRRVVAKALYSTSSWGYWSRPAEVSKSTASQSPAVIGDRGRRRSHTFLRPSTFRTLRLRRILLSDVTPITLIDGLLLTLLARRS